MKLEHLAMKVYFISTSFSNSFQESIKVINEVKWAIFCNF